MRRISFTIFRSSLGLVLLLGSSLALAKDKAPSEPTARSVQVMEASCPGLLGEVAGFQTDHYLAMTALDRIQVLARTSRQVFDRDQAARYEAYGPRIRESLKSVSVYYITRYQRDPFDLSKGFAERFTEDMERRREEWVHQQLRSRQLQAQLRSNENFEEALPEGGPLSLSLMLAPNSVRRVQVEDENKIFRPLDPFVDVIGLEAEPFHTSLRNKIWKLQLAQEIQARFFPEEQIFPKMQIVVLDDELGLLIDELDYVEADGNIDFFQVSEDEQNRMMAFQFLLGATDLSNGKNLMRMSDGRLINYDPSASFDFSFRFADGDESRRFGSQLPDAYPEGFDRILIQIVQDIKSGEHLDLPDAVRYRLLFASEIMLQDMRYRRLIPEN